MPREFDPDPSGVALAALEESCQKVLLSLRLADARIERLLGTAFEDQVRAIAGLRRCMRSFGFDGTMKVLRDEVFLGRTHYLGFTKGSLFARGDRERSREALHELPEAIRDRETLSRQVGDLIQVRRTMQEEATRREFVPDPGRGGNGRGRSRTR